MAGHALRKAHVQYREEVLPGDRDVVRDIIASSGFFSQA